MSLQRFLLFAVVIVFGACRTPGTPPPAQGPRLLALGSVQDGGLPHAGCDRANCAAARRDPQRGRTVASLAILVPETGEAYLLDASPDIRAQLHRLSQRRGATGSGVNRAPLEGIFLTHAHIGHYLGLAFLGMESLDTRDIPVWATPEMCAFLRDNGPWSQLVGRQNISLREMTPGTPVPLSADLQVTPLPIPHRDEYADTVGFRIEGPARTALYVPDTNAWQAWPGGLPAKLEGVDLAILDGTFFSADELPGRDLGEIPHPLISDSMDLLQAAVDAGKLRVLFTHLNHSNPALNPTSPERREIEARGFGVLEEGWETGL